MNSAAEDPIVEALQSGETVLWRGRPVVTPARQGLGPSMRLLGIAGAVVSGLASALTIYALVAALRHGDHFEAPLLLMLTLVTLSLFAACVRFAARNFSPELDEDARTHYAITSRRVIVAIAGNPVTIRALPNDGALEFDCIPRVFGPGSITFGLRGDTSFTLEPVMFHSILDTATPMQVLQDSRTNSA